MTSSGHHHHAHRPRADYKYYRSGNSILVLTNIIVVLTCSMIVLTISSTVLADSTILL